MTKRVTQAMKIAEYDRRRSEDYQAAQHAAAETLRQLLTTLTPDQVTLLGHYLKHAEAEYQLVRNARFGGLVVEHRNTPYSCSVASDAYWQN